MPDRTADRSIVRHVVFFSCKDKADIDRVVDGLWMLKDIPTVSHFEVSKNRNQDRFGNEVDVVVYAEFADEAALSAYRAHPIYEESIRLVRPLRDLRIAADF